MPTHAAYQAFKGRKPTAPDIEGPFYKAGAPFRQKLTDGLADLTLSGAVRDTEGRPVPGAVLDFWGADAAGDYDNAGFALRGKVRAGADGRYRVETVRPGHYPIGGGEYRCAHVHVKIAVEGYRPLTTQLYFAGDEYNAADHWYDKGREVRPSQFPGVAVFDFVLERETPSP